MGFRLKTFRLLFSGISGLQRILDILVHLAYMGNKASRIFFGTLRVGGRNICFCAVHIVCFRLFEQISSAHRVRSRDIIFHVFARKS